MSLCMMESLVSVSMILECLKCGFRIVSLFVYMPQKCVRYGTDASYINNKI